MSTANDMQELVDILEAILPTHVPQLEYMRMRRHIERLKLQVENARRKPCQMHKGFCDGNCPPDCPSHKTDPLGR